MLSKQLKDLKVQKNVNVFEDKNIDKLTRSKYKLFKNFYKNFILTSLHIESIKKCLNNLKSVNKSFNEFDNLFLLEEGDILNYFYDENEKGEKELYLKHREFLTEEEEKIIFKKIKLFLKLCSVYTNKKEIKILIEFLIYKYEINIKCSQDIILCILPNIFLLELKNIIEIIFIEKQSPFYFINNYKHDELKRLDKSVFIQNIKKNISIYKILFEYLIDLINCTIVIQNIETHIPFIDFFISITYEIVNSYIDMPFHIIEFYCNIFLVLIKIGKCSFNSLNHIYTIKNEDSLDPFKETKEIHILRLYNCSLLFKNFLDIFEISINKCKKDVNLTFLKSKIFLFEKDFLLLNEQVIDQSHCAEFVKCLIILLNIIYKYSYKISFKKYTNEEEKTVDEEKKNGENKTDDKTKKNEKNLLNIINFVKENKQDYFNNNINYVIKEKNLIIKLLYLFCEADVYEIIDNIIKHILIKTYSLELDFFIIVDIFTNLLNKNIYIFNIILIINLISFYIFLIKRAEEQEEDEEEREKNKSKIQAVELLLKRNNNNICKEDFNIIVKYFIKENNILFKEKIILFEIYSKIDEKLLELINIYNNKLTNIEIFNSINFDNVDFNNDEIVEEALKNIKFIYEHKKKLEISNDDDKKEIFDESFNLDLIKKGTNYLKSKKYIKCLYFKVILLLKKSKIQFIDYLKIYEKELLYFFPSKKYLYRIIFNSFKELKFNKFCELDKERNKIFLKFYIQLFMIKLKKLEMKNNKKLKDDKFFKKFINFNFSFFFIIYDCVTNHHFYPEHSYFSRNIEEENFKLVKTFFIYLLKLKNIQYYNFDEFFENEVKYHRFENIKILIKYSSPFKALILFRIMYYFSKLNISYLMNIKEMHNLRNKDDHVESSMQLNNIEDIKDKNKKIEKSEKKELKFFLLKIFNILLKNMDDINYLKSDIKNNIYIGILETFQTSILLFVNFDVSLASFLYYKYINIFYLNETYIRFVLDTVDSFFNLFKIDNFKKFIKDNNMFIGIVIELYKKILKNCNKLDIKIFYKFFIISIMLHTIPDVDSSGRITYMWKLLKKMSFNKTYLINYNVINKVFKENNMNFLNNLSFPNDNNEYDGNYIINEDKDNCDNNNNYYNNNLNDENEDNNDIDKIENNKKSNQPNKENNSIEENEISFQSLSDDYSFDYRCFLPSSKYLSSRKNVYRESSKYYLFAFAYLNKHFFDIFLLNFHTNTFHNSIVEEFLNKDLILIFLKIIMQKNSYPYKITQIYKFILAKCCESQIKVEHISLFLYLIDFYVNVLDNKFVKKKKNNLKNDNVLIDNNSVINRSSNKKGDYINKKLLKTINTQNLNTNSEELKNKLFNKKIKKINYKNILDEGNEDIKKNYFQKLKGFYKYHENLFENYYFDKGRELKTLCESIISIIINDKNNLLTIQLLCIKNFSSSSLFKNNLRLSLEKMEICNLMIFKRIFLNKKSQDDNFILLMCKNVKSVIEKNKILLFIEKKIIKHTKTSYFKILKYLNALSDGKVENNSACVHFINSHIRIFRKISNNLQPNDSIFLKLIKYVTNICRLIYDVPDLVEYHFSLIKNNFLTYIISFFCKNINYFYENITSHIKPFAYVFDKIIQRRIMLFINFNKKHESNNCSQQKYDENKKRINKELYEENNDYHDFNFSKKRKILNIHPTIYEDPLIYNEKKDEGKNIIDDEDISYNCEQENHIKYSNEKDNKNLIADFVENEEEINKYYHLHIFGFMCTLINKVFKKEIDLKHFTILTNNLIFLFNKSYSSYVISISLINLIIKIKLEKIYACKNYIVEIFNVYYFSDIDYCINNHLLLLLSLYLCPYNYKKNNLLKDECNEDRNKGNEMNSEDDEIIYPNYVKMKLKYIKPHLKKVKNIHNLCLKIITLISIISTINKRRIQSISYFVYFSTFQNFILCFCFSKNKVINRKLNVLFKKFSFRNTDTFILYYILNNYRIKKDILENKNNEEDKEILEIAEGKNKIVNNKRKNIYYFENLFLYKFLFYLNKLKGSMKFNESCKKYLKLKENKSITNETDCSKNNKHFLYDIFNVLMVEQDDDNINNIIKQNVFNFYEFIIDKLVHLNYINYKNLFKQIIIFINHKLNYEIDAKHIFDAIMHFIYEKKEKRIFPLNEIYIYNIFNKSLFKIKLDNSMIILIVSKINEILKRLFEQYYIFYNIDRKNKISCEDRDHKKEGDIVNNNIKCNQMKKKNKIFDLEIYMINDAYNKYSEILSEKDEENKKDNSNNLDNNVELLCLSDVNSVDSNYSFNDECNNNNEDKKEKEIEYDLKEIDYIKYMNEIKDFKQIFLLDNYYLNTILKCICSLLINFPQFTKKKMIELLKVLFFSNTKYILLNEKNVFNNNFYNLSKEKKIKYISKIIENPLKKINLYHLFFIFSNNDIKICFKYLSKYYRKFYNYFKDTSQIYSYKKSVVLNNSLFIYQNLIIFQNIFDSNIIMGIGLKLLFSLIKNYIKNCCKYITLLYEKYKMNIMYLNTKDFYCYNDNYCLKNSEKSKNQLLVDMRVEEQNIVTSLVYTSSKLKFSSLENLFEKLVLNFENKHFESNSLNIYDQYKTIYEKRIYFLYFYKLYQNFGSVLSENNKYLFDLLNNIKFSLILCQKNYEQFFENLKSEAFKQGEMGREVEEKEHSNYYEDKDENREIDKFFNEYENEKKTKFRKNISKSKWYWFELGYCTLLCLYEILKNEKKNQKNFTAIFYQTCFDNVINCFDFFIHLPRIHINDDFKNTINEKIVRNSEFFDMKQTSIILLDLLKLILLEFYSLYLNDPEKIQIMTMRISLKNNNNNNIIISIILTLKYIYETIGYKELLFSVKDLYQIFSELNDHPDDEIEFLTKEWLNSISKHTET
ncbi:conserved Plasmodium protein, unknown function [Plasmodium gallinaceum]|uniref:Uncharacterized protein n=1 Tax=Plasmodium gallinaceum TaxID=5849 RepID=A0A1J1GSC0_PLAGA|nr:conserved Plasmodium protein, unknown function [Plasmodium gallinaceum]CRG93947.1 conserved Plasmodium protein, unknown function [Plasmodium gallinaceum]